MGRKRGFVADVEGMFADYQLGMNQEEIATKYGINQSNVSANLRKHPNWPNRRAVVRRSNRGCKIQRKVYDRDAILADYRAGLLFKDIALRHGITEMWASRVVRSHPEYTKREQPIREGCEPVIDGKRRCITCKVITPINGFYKSSGRSFRGCGIVAHCKKCAKSARNAYHKEIYAKLRNAVIAGYGGCCALCGYSDVRALHIDHVNNDGHVDRKTTYALQLLRRIIRLDFPCQYQILCANCNAIKAHEAGSFKRLRITAEAI